MDPMRTHEVDCLKLENFNGSNFNAWRWKVFFGMQLLKIYYVVSEEKHDSEEDSESEASWTRDYHFCRSYLFNCLADHLAYAYTNKPYAKEIQNALEGQYKDKAKLSKSYIVDKFLDLKFEDDTKVLPQVKELKKLVMKPKDEKISICQTFISGEIVNKLPPSWMSFSTDIRRRKRHVTLSDLKRFIRIEDEIRTRTKTEFLTKQKASANMVAANFKKDNNSSFKKMKSFNRKKNQNPKNLNTQKKEFKKSGKRFNCGKQ
ncbi:uncharacterized protein LOC109834945 [Asparagus officinalis]|uniref:uncharacterized protein LOC109834945 n=1 Tax=Asparagus officinalis TaxID=4686 RepID=UPI00098E80DD|nr:uncharacterized protein LOC109834945 [Asparagus officinalis]